jgi:hypothetical protein
VHTQLKDEYVLDGSAHEGAARRAHLHLEDRTMLRFWGQRHPRFCDGLSRRDFLQVGTLGLGGLTLADLLRTKAQGAVDSRASHKAVIMIYLGGAPSHLDMYDMKPDAPAEVRGEFKPIRTKVPGLDICELMPLQARIADKLAVVRNMRFTEGDHNCTEFVTGYPGRLVSGGVADGPVQRRHPDFGSVVSRLRGWADNRLPPYVLLGPPKEGLEGAGDPAYLGSAHRPFSPTGQDMANLSLHYKLTLQRMNDRKHLLGTFDTLRHDLDTRGNFSGIDAFNRQALDMITSPRVRDAFDIAQEPGKLRGKYGRLTSFLQARRLVEAGVSVVTLSFAYWDTHQKNFETLRRQLPELDQGLSALVMDLHERGLDQDVAVVMGGEFGRTPKVNREAGRDHWWEAGFMLFAGGGLKTGQLIGATTRHADRPTGTPYMPQNVLATLYRVLGIDPATTVPDHSGRPMYLLDDRRTIGELL